MEPEHLVGRCLADADQAVGTDEYSTRDKGRRILDDVWVFLQEVPDQPTRLLSARIL